MLMPILNVNDKTFQMYQTFVVRDDIVQNLRGQLEMDAISIEDYNEQFAEVMNFDNSVESIIEKYSDTFESSDNVIYLQPQEVPSNHVIIFNEDEYELINFEE